jgi:3',5'-nucleoside bisphosphate phosphatase
VRILADLHNHSCLSPCASLEQSPSVLARTARARGIGILALTDHNSALNCPAFDEACRRERVAPLFGIEANSVEEVHVVCLFGTAGDALGFGEALRSRMRGLALDRDRFGDQVVVDADEVVLDQPEYFLGASLLEGFDEICSDAAARGAVVVPAHVDRPMFSVSSQLGFLPPGPYDAVESIREPGPELTNGLAAISGSDAHRPEDVGRRPFRVELPEDIVRSRVSAGSGPGADAAGRELLEALRSALRSGAVRPCWAAGDS